MQQRQLRLGDILDDYCPRERRLTNHAVVAMVGDEVKQTRCTTCDADHEYKHARVPRQRRKSEPAALYSQVVAGAPKKVVHETIPEGVPVVEAPSAPSIPLPESAPAPQSMAPPQEPVADNEPATPPAATIEDGDAEPETRGEDGPVHRQLIRAQLPRTDNQPPPARPAPDFTIRQPGGRQNRFRPRHQRGGQGFQGNRSGGNLGGNVRGGSPHHGGRPPMGSARGTKRHNPHGSHGQHGPQGHGRKRSK
jgi:hypothetical protein